MSDSEKKSASAEEQAICLKCGFCCDGTLFLRATVKPGDVRPFPEKIDCTVFYEADYNYFRLPCSYFSSGCTIYDDRRPLVCGDFRCQLLKDFTDGRINMDEAVSISGEAIVMRDNLLMQYKKISGRDEETCFQGLLVEFARMQSIAREDDPVNNDYDILLAGCNIFEALITKHFRSKSDFDKMMGEVPES
jgi:hypothetical protein